jgi:hypothetical protein
VNRLLDTAASPFNVVVSWAASFAATRAHVDFATRIAAMR